MQIIENTESTSHRLDNPDQRLARKFFRVFGRVFRPLNDAEFFHRFFSNQCLTRRASIYRIGVCLYPFQLAWEYLLFDNRMKQARTRLVFGFCSGCTRAEAI